MERNLLKLYCSSVVEDLLGILEVLGSTPTISKEKSYMQNVAKWLSIFFFR